jgi:hypothetical protein
MATWFHRRRNLLSIYPGYIDIALDKGDIFGDAL